MHTEPLVMISVLFFILCYSMSPITVLNLEKTFKGGSLMTTSSGNLAQKAVTETGD